jgi:hypothetical protein
MPGIEWVAESLRFTAFMAPGAEPKYDLYKAFTGSDPDEAAERHPRGVRSPPVPRTLRARAPGGGGCRKRPIPLLSDLPLRDTARVTLV